jgi:hypothetical protein
LKQDLQYPAAERSKVAPLAGAWIETLVHQSMRIFRPSRPSRARGLKRKHKIGESNEDWSRPSRARGLKLEVGSLDVNGSMSRPSRARGLKLQNYLSEQYGIGSRPSRARGLKRIIPALICSLPWSRPSRARGLKLINAPFYATLKTVAPLAGAWIETTVRLKMDFLKMSRAPRGRVD